MARVFTHQTCKHVYLCHACVSGSLICLLCSDKKKSEYFSPIRQLVQTEWYYLMPMLLLRTLSHVQLLRHREQKPATLLCQWDVSGKNTGVGCSVLLPGIFPARGWDRRLPACLFVLLCSSWGSHGKYPGLACHSLPQWITFGQNCPLLLVRLGWSCMAWLIASSSHTGPCTTARPWSVKRMC